MFGPEDIDKLRQKFVVGVLPPDERGCILWKASAKSGRYGIVRVNAQVTMNTHRAAWLLAHGMLPPSDLYVCHTCDVRPCVNIEHLFLGTAKENQEDARRKGRRRTAPRRPILPADSAPSLSLQDALRIRALDREGVGAIVLARAFGVSRQSIWNIVSGKTFVTARS